MFGRKNTLFIPGLVVLLLTNLMLAPVWAAQPGDQISLIHKPPQAQELPPPGVPMQLRVRLNHTRSTDLKLNTLITRDGRIMQLAVNKVYLNEYDEPTYDLLFPAPLAEIAYQFFLIKSDGKVIPSARYLVRRSCVPKVDVGLQPLDPDSQGQKKMDELISHSKALQTDVENLDRAYKLAGELQELLK